MFCVGFLCRAQCFGALSVFHPVYCNGQNKAKNNNDLACATTFPCTSTKNKWNEIYFIFID